jgi:hypothetical protein
MTAHGFDAIHASIDSIPANADVIMGYDTGTPNIKWTGADYAHFPNARQVHIDQGGVGSPTHTAHVRDVETGAWTPESAVTQTDGWNVPRPTIYCNLNTLPRVLAAGWKGDLWLAIPSDLPPAKPPEIPGCTVVAIQWKFATTYDMSVVYDDAWPRKEVSMPPQPPPGPWNVDENYPWQGAILTVIGADSKIHAYEYDMTSETWKRLDTIADTQ